MTDVLFTPATIHVQGFFMTDAEPQQFSYSGSCLMFGWAGQRERVHFQDGASLVLAMINGELAMGVRRALPIVWIVRLFSRQYLPMRVVRISRWITIHKEQFHQVDYYPPWVNPWSNSTSIMPTRIDLKLMYLQLVFFLSIRHKVN